MPMPIIIDEVRGEVAPEAAANATHEPPRRQPEPPRELEEERRLRAQRHSERRRRRLSAEG
jgi:hypothetical protein